jgi:hypothetical protein
MHYAFIVHVLFVLVLGVLCNVEWSFTINSRKMLTVLGALVKVIYYSKITLKFV